MIYLLWCTCRPNKFKDYHRVWMERAVHPEDVYTRVAVDSISDYNEVEEYNAIIVKNPDFGIVHPLNCLCEKLKAQPDDIIVVPSDDFLAPDHWDMYLKEQFIEFSGVLKVNDGSMKDIISIPVMTYEAFEKMNRVIYHPAYQHMYSDKELERNARDLGILKEADHTHPEFRHHHYIHSTRHKDEFDERVNSDFGKYKELYEKRAKMPVEERLKK